MIRVHGNTSGPKPESVSAVYAMLDSGYTVYADLTVPNRYTFAFQDGSPAIGGTVIWPDNAQRFILNTKANALVHPGRALPPGDYEGSLLDVPMPTLNFAPVVSTPRLHVEGDQFVTADGKIFVWKGASAFRWLEQYIAGRDLTGAVNQLKNAGGNNVRVLAMKFNNTGWQLNPHAVPDYWGHVHRFVREMAANGLYVEFTVFADTRYVMNVPSTQQQFWEQAVQMADKNDNVILELLNEAGHGTQAIDPQAFRRPPAHILASHGSGLSDAHPVTPYWSHSTWHSPRHSDSRGFSQCYVYAWEEDWPVDIPRVNNEPQKPETHGFDRRFSYNMGRSCGLACGGTFHSSSGVNGLGWNGPEHDCAVSFYEGIDASR